VRGFGRRFNEGQHWAAWGAFALGLAVLVVAILSLRAAQDANRSSTENSRRIQEVLEASKPHPATKVAYYTPPALNSDDGTHVGHADCLIGASLVTARADAARCFLDGGGVADPCFLPSVVQSGLRLYCPPFSERDSQLVVTVDSTRGAPDDGWHPVPGGAPWAIRLANGRWCYREGGATGVVGEYRLNYFCKGVAGGVLGNPQTDSKTWTVLYQPDFTRDATPVEIRKARL